MSRYRSPLPAGAELRPDGSARFRLWAPSAATAVLHIDGRDVPMTPEPGGWHAAATDAVAGSQYCYTLPDGLRVPDPASRAQSHDVHGSSVVVDPLAYAWRSAEWLGRPWHEAVILEVHVGLLGGFDAVAARLPEWRSLGITVVELMPIADFPGERNWGYDGVLPYAPDTSYGTSGQLKHLVDSAHLLGMSVMLDVVYNHFGPDGNYLHSYAAPFFRKDSPTAWGDTIEFDLPEVREYFTQNAIYWLMEYRFDGLRFDAVHAIPREDALIEMARAIRAAVEPGRHVHLVLEHEGNRASLLRPAPGRPSYDAQWADDLHHCLHVLLTGERDGYYADFEDATPLLARVLREGFAYQGQVSPHLGRPRGEPSGDLPMSAFVVCLQNHDQIGNRAFGERLTALADPDALRAAQTLVLLAPFVPLLFMGEEWGARTPFLYFTSHNEALAALVRDGRRAEFKAFPAFQGEASRARIPDPNDPATFEASRPDRPDPAAFQFVQQALAARHRHVTPGIPGCVSNGATVLGDGAVAASWRLGTGRRLTVLLNLGAEAAGVAVRGGDVLFASGPDVEAQVRAGRLPPRRALALLDAGDA